MKNTSPQPPPPFSVKRTNGPFDYSYLSGHSFRQRALHSVNMNIFYQSAPFFYDRRYNFKDEDVSEISVEWDFSERGRNYGDMRILATSLDMSTARRLPLACGATGFRVGESNPSVVWLSYRFHSVGFSQIDSFPQIVVC